jgi:hypothetical protein
MKTRPVVLLLILGAVLAGCASTSEPEQRKPAKPHPDEAVESPGRYWMRRDLQDRIDAEREKTR